MAANSYPFKDFVLARADIEWLLINHEDQGIRGPVYLGLSGHETRQGIDLRGAILTGEQLDELPLARTCFGMTNPEWRAHNLAEHIAAAAHLEHVNFSRTDLREALLTRAFLEHADLSEAHLERASMKGALLGSTYLGRAFLYGTDLFQASMNASTLLEGTHFGDGKKTNGPILADVDWGAVRLDQIDWRQVPELGDANIARRWSARDYASEFGRSLLRPEYSARRANRLIAAVRANRQLATLLRGQGLYEAADVYAFRAQVLQRKVLWRQHSWGKWTFSWLLALMFGYGFRLRRLVIAYAIILATFAIAYYVASQLYPPALPLDEAILVSFTAIHGRVFIGQFGLSSALSWIAGIEAVAGVIVEGAFVALLIQRLFGR